MVFERVPEPAVRCSPGAERGRGVVAGIDVDEHGAARVQRDGQFEREVAPGRAGGSPVHPDGQRCGFDPERLERSDLLVLRGKPGQTRVLDHIVEREQAPHEHAGRRRAAVADVLSSERAIEAPFNTHS